MRIDPPFTADTRVAPADGSGPFRVTAAAPRPNGAPGEYFVGLRHVESDHGFRFFNRVWQDADGAWIGANDPAPPVHLAITGLVGATAPAAPAPPLAPPPAPAAPATPVAAPDAAFARPKRVAPVDELPLFAGLL